MGAAGGRRAAQELPRRRRRRTPVDCTCARLPAGISLKTQELYALVFVTRYLDLFYSYISLCAAAAWALAAAAGRSSQAAACLPHAVLMRRARPSRPNSLQLQLHHEGDFHCHSHLHHPLHAV